MSGVSGVVELLRLMLLQGDIGLGERVIESELARTLRMRRSAVREAFRRLEGEGLLVLDSDGATRVIELDERELVATLRVRAALEALSAGLAAGRFKDGRVSDRPLQQLHELAESVGSVGPGQARVLADRHFHRAVAAVGANQLCRDALDHAWDRLVLAAAHSVPGADRIAIAGHEHHQLLRAIEAGDEDEASAIARRHVLAALT